MFNFQKTDIFTRVKVSQDIINNEKTSGGETTVDFLLKIVSKSKLIPYLDMEIYPLKSTINEIFKYKLITPINNNHPILYHFMILHGSKLEIIPARFILLGSSSMKIDGLKYKNEIPFFCISAFNQIFEVMIAISNEIQLFKIFHIFKKSQVFIDLSIKNSQMNILRSFLVLFDFIGCILCYEFQTKKYNVVINGSLFDILHCLVKKIFFKEMNQVIKIIPFIQKKVDNFFIGCCFFIGLFSIKVCYDHKNGFYFSISLDYKENVKNLKINKKEIQTSL